MKSAPNDFEFTSPAAEEWLDRMTTVHAQIISTLKKINDKRSELSLEKPREFAVGDCTKSTEGNHQANSADVQPPEKRSKGSKDFLDGSWEDIKNRPGEAALSGLRLV